MKALIVCLIALCGSYAESVAVHCEFIVGYYGYKCEVKSLRITSKDDRSINEVTGEHLSGKNDSDVKWFESINHKVHFFLSSSQHSLRIWKRSAFTMQHWVKFTARTLSNSVGTWDNFGWAETQLKSLTRIFFSLIQMWITSRLGPTNSDTLTMEPSENSRNWKNYICKEIRALMSIRDLKTKLSP